MVPTLPSQLHSLFAARDHNSPHHNGPILCQSSLPLADDVASIFELCDSNHAHFRGAAPLAYHLLAAEVTSSETMPHQ